MIDDIHTVAALVLPNNQGVTAGCVSSQTDIEDRNGEAHIKKCGAANQRHLSQIEVTDRFNRQVGNKTRWNECQEQYFDAERKPIVWVNGNDDKAIQQLIADAAAGCCQKR